jgi:hypothetical protein
MRTFHQHKHELHGITVVVEARAEGAAPEAQPVETYVGRCDDIVGGRIVLMDGDLHREGESAVSKEDFLRKAARFGPWKKYDHVLVDTARVSSIRRLGDL